MAISHQAIDFVLSNEGGFVDNPNDSGGATNYGLSLRFLRQIPAERLRKYGIFTTPESLGVEAIQDLTPDQARMVYEGEFWNDSFSKIASQYIANYVFDMAVLHGANQAIKILQRAIWAAMVHKDFVHDDGILGSKTLDVLNTVKETGMIIALMAERAGFCRLLCEINPKNREFLDGWLNRCYRI